MASGHDFQVAMSFADEDREYVSRVVDALRVRDLHVFYDADHTVELWGRDLTAYFDDVYRRRSQFVVIFVSRHYASKQWTRHELKSALARALAEKQEYVLPARFDDTDLPGLPPTIHHVDCRELTPDGLAEMIHQKILRSGARRSVTDRPIERTLPVEPAVDVAEISIRAEERTRHDSRSATPTVAVGVAFGPTRQVIRPYVFGSRWFGDLLMQRAMFGENSVLAPGERTETSMRDDVLTLAQTNRSISVDELATITVRGPAVEPYSPGTLSAIIDDIVEAVIERSLRLSVQLVRDLDEDRRFTHMLPVACLLRTGPGIPWRTAAEHAASRSQMTLNMQAPDRIVAKLRDPAVAISSLPARIGSIAEDLTALIARRMLQTQP
jgi:TIR domain